MNGKFVIYAFVVSFIGTIGSWNKIVSSNGSGSSSYRSGSSWNSNTGSWGGGGGGHK